MKSWDGTIVRTYHRCNCKRWKYFSGTPKDFPSDFQVEVNNPEVALHEAIISDFPLYIELSESTAVGISETSDKPLKTNLASSFGRVMIRWSDRNGPSRFP
jgi:hypothetical protein